MRCPKCEAQGERSTVYDPMGSTRTAMPVNAYWDEDGHHHYHDPNSSSRHFTCSRGHDWNVSSKAPCPSCNFNREDSAEEPR